MYHRCNSVVNIANFDQKIRLTHQKLSQLEQEVILHPQLNTPLFKVLSQELALALEELHVLQEELSERYEELLNNRQRLELERQRYQELFDFAPDGYLVTDASGVIAKANHTAAQLLNVSSRFLIGKPLALYIDIDTVNSSSAHSTERSCFYQQTKRLRAGGVLKAWEVTIQPRQRPQFPAEISASPIYAPSGQLAELRWQIRDISDRQQVIAMRSQLNLDGLTQIANRRCFDQRLAQLWAQMAQAQQPLALILIDIDFFKRYNDTYGHQAGDSCLQEVASAICRILTAPDYLVARYGGEEFAVLLPAAQIAQAQKMAELIQAAIGDLKIVHCASPINQQLTLSLGLTSSVPTQTDSAASLVERADKALYQAKRSGRNCTKAFTEQAALGWSPPDALKYDLPQALEQQQFQLHYQPIVSLSTGRLTAVEALIRWEHPTEGLLAPSHFLAIAERTGLIIPLSWWILKTACTQLRQWQRDNRSLVLHINLPAQQFYQVNFVAQLTQILDETGVAASDLILEVTETALLEAETYRQLDLQQLQSLGVQLAIDDFGTGYSSLSRLQALPISHLKLDRSFTQTIPLNPKSVAIVQAVVALTQTLNLGLVVEGIEHPEQLQCLRALGCRCGQGFLFSEPLASHQVDSLIYAGQIGLPYDGWLTRAQARFSGRVVEIGSIAGQTGR